VPRNLFPAFLDLTDRPALVVGGGPVAAAKARRLVEAGARVVCVAPVVCDEMATLPVSIERRPFCASDLEGRWFVVSAATREVNALVEREATARRIFVNAVDDPAHATAFAGSAFNRGPVTVAISTGGDAPALARVLREALERVIGPDVADWTALGRRLRRDWKREGVPMDRRRDLLLEALAGLHQEVVGHRPRRETSDRNEGRPRTAHGRNGSERGFVSIVGAGPGDPELLTRLAARRLREADLVLYDALVSPEAVSLASRASRIPVGRRSGSDPIGQDAIVRALVGAARRGRRVVRLKGGDAFVFGRGGEEALALARAGIAFEVVPGVSSALAAPALAHIPVTHRGTSSAVLVTSGHDIDRLETLVGGLSPGTATLVVLMGTRSRAAIAEALGGAGWPASTPAAVVWDASGAAEQIWTGRLDRLAESSGPPNAAGTIVVGSVVALREAMAGARATSRAPDLLEGRNACLS
jgi:uroporphyrin-III C-methyltransferase/precorrin-2 dehydrogenase/sirohydrochlorin ferrochelatase